MFDPLNDKQHYSVKIEQQRIFSRLQTFIKNSRSSLLNIKQKRKGN